MSDEGTLHIPLSGNTISRFFKTLKTVVDYLRRQSNKSVTTSVSRSLHKIIYSCRQRFVVPVYSDLLAILKCMHAKQLVALLKDDNKLKDERVRARQVRP